ncbi:hypothetical protein L3Q82_015631 [Scortum barcoo]|uniref:Uncharacterized protein n=1 Tax=Scortum barcoo TaxID=214431 RepID=A0ACB8VQJ5_9TELE|nr:hypothetical protein L3Q82_015631 [Scortum barcoo]
MFRHGPYVRMLFIDYSSAFNTIVPSKLVTKLRDLGINSALCDWILNFLTGRPQAVRMGSTTSSTLTLNTDWRPQGCVLSPLLYSLFTHDCVATNSSNAIVKFADDTTVIGLITSDDKTAYREVRGQRPDILVPGQQPPSQRQQNKGADRGLHHLSPSGVGGRLTGSLRTPVTQPQTVLSAAVWPTVPQHSKPEPPGSEKLHPAGHKTH